MSGFNECEAAFENKFAHDAEMMFKAAARRNKLLGLWLAPQINQDDADTYAKTVVVADLEEKGGEDVVKKVMADIKAAGASVSEADVRAKLVELGAEAKAQIISEVD